MEVMAMELQIKKGKWFWSFVLAINMTKGGGGGGGGGGALFKKRASLSVIYKPGPSEW